MDHGVSRDFSGMRAVHVTALKKEVLNNAPYLLSPPSTPARKADAVYFLALIAV